MSRAALKTASAPTMAHTGQQPLRVIPDALGDSANSAVFKEIGLLKASTAKLARMVKLLKKASAAVKREAWRDAAQAAMAALEIDETEPSATHIVAIALEKAGELPLALTMYERTLQFAPNDPEVLHNLGLLAWRMEQLPLARTFLAKAVQEVPDRADILNNYACTLRDLGLHDEAIELLRGRLIEAPNETVLWNALGTIVLEQGLFNEAIAFYLEAIRLDPTYGRAQHNIGHALYEAGRLDESIDWLNKALALHSRRADALESRHARALARLGLGDLEGGWADYAARTDPEFSKSLQFSCGTAKLWDGGALANTSILLMGEQGLGDEVLFMSAVPDLLDAVGPDKRLTIATEGRLVPLVARSFPNAKVVSHITGKTANGMARIAAGGQDQYADIEVILPMGDAVRALRPDIASFAQEPGFLKADPERIAFWKAWIVEATKGLAVGITWKSLIMTAARAKYFSPFDVWADTLSTEGVTFINLQYGDSAAELAAAHERFGVTILQPPGIDLKNDLDDLAALTCALDLVIGPMNATTNIAAACGADVWIVSGTDRAWTMMATGGLPWYPQVRVFSPETVGDWATVMADMQQALALRAS